jgi:hypothetical protein
MTSMVEFALAVVGAVFIFGCLGVAALLWFTRGRFQRTARSEDDPDWW